MSRLAASLSLVLLVIAVYGQVGRHDFVALDDDWYVYDNPVVKRGLTADGVRWAFATPHRGNWHPITWLSHMADVELFGVSPGAHHVVSVAVHAANAVLLFMLLRGMTGALGGSLLAAGLFALHPLNVESVAWVSERKEILGALFFLLTLFAYVRFTRRPTLASYLPVPILFVMTLLSKAMAVTLPFVLLLLDYWPLARFHGGGSDPAGEKGNARGPQLPRMVLLEKVPLVFLSAASCLVTYLAQQREGAMSAFAVLPLSDRLAYAAISYLAYLGRAVFPHALSLHYPHPSVAGIDVPAWKTAGAAIAIALVAAIAFLGRRRSPCLATGWFWYLGMLVPVIGIVQVGTQLTADRFGYLPLIGIFLAASWIAADLLASPRWRALRAGGGALLLGVLAALTWNQTSFWRNSESIFRHSLVTTPNNSLLRTNLANVLQDEGRFAEALVEYRRAIGDSPNDANARYNLAVALTRLGRVEEAVSQYRDVLRLRPDDVYARGNLGVLLLRTGLKEEAIRHLEEALRLDPSDRVALRALQGVSR